MGGETYLTNRPLRSDLKRGRPRCVRSPPSRRWDGIWERGLVESRGSRPRRELSVEISRTTTPLLTTNLSDCSRDECSLLSGRWGRAIARIDRGGDSAWDDTSGVLFPSGVVWRKELLRRRPARGIWDGETLGGSRRALAVGEELVRVGGIEREHSQASRGSDMRVVIVGQGGSGGGEAKVIFLGGDMMRMDLGWCSGWRGAGDIPCDASGGWMWEE